MAEDDDEKVKKEEGAKGDEAEESSGAKKEEEEEEEEAAAEAKEGEEKSGETTKDDDAKEEGEGDDAKKEETDDEGKAAKKEADADDDAMEVDDDADDGGATPSKSKTEDDPETQAAAGGGPSSPSSSSSSKKRKKSQIDVLIEGDISAPSSSKRARKSVAEYRPENFVAAKTAAAEKAASSDPTSAVPIGRGTPLCDIESVRERLKKESVKSPTLACAHKLLVGGRGRVKEKLRKVHLLKFYGYLPPPPEGVSKEKIDEMEEDIEAKMSEKAYRLTTPVLRNLCDLFDVDRHRPPEGKSIVGKDELIDRLLNFLGEPTEKMTKTYVRKMEASKKSGSGGRKSTVATPKKGGKSPGKVKADRAESSAKKKKGKKRAKREEEEEEEEEEDEETEEEEEEEEEDEEEENEEEEEEAEAEAMEEEEEDKKKKKKKKPAAAIATLTSASASASPATKKKTKMPGDKALRRWVRAYVRCFNLDKATTKHAIETASDKFGVDLTERKARIKELLTEEMS